MTRSPSWSANTGHPATFHAVCCRCRWALVIASDGRQRLRACRGRLHRVRRRLRFFRRELYRQLLFRRCILFGLPGRICTFCRLTRLGRLRLGRTRSSPGESGRPRAAQPARPTAPFLQRPVDPDPISTGCRQDYPAPADYQFASDSRHRLLFLARRLYCADE